MKRIFFVFIFILLLAGCQSNPQVETDTFVPEVTSAYPAFGQEIQQNTAYPMPTAESAVAPTPTTAAGTGKVTGTIQLNGKPVENILLFLGTFLKNSEGVEYTAVVEPAFSPQAYTDAEGKFTFVNITPGKYTLVLDNVTSQFLLFKPGTQDHYTIEVMPDSTVDMGELNYDELPLPKTE